MDLRIGFSVSSKVIDDPGTAGILESMLSAGCTTIQIQALQKPPPAKLKFPDVIKRFRYRAIHLPYLRDPVSDRQVIDSMLNLAKEIEAQDFTLHPLGMGSFGWLEEEFGGLLSVENMDCQKNFGQTPADLSEVFAQLPNAGWVFDVNHVKTNDPSMKLADDLYDALKPKLKHYHLSGYLNAEIPHTLLAETKQDEIIAKVRDKTKPIIIESLGSEDLDRFREELDYILARL